ncbi:hypothetical protein M436DRAFT_66466 [Aureobasidium namibiae CBS 147.97]|uniref:Uncharacterized protein n=1 Tax=Aureobasidium namibiae CBS 147.97 TaxID=1043004 RepID=A0A074WC89_9PEZI|nr:uncharacterized protein M436DRAFT_66466 [Aureobasidium namibiae CBS 147.97]KEQ70568.1 hypothetical protein M436DRAFT_66466 [Aureobasidium namibiae CBS 147.97]
MATALLGPREIRLLNERYYRGVMVMEIMKLSLVLADSKCVKLSLKMREEWSAWNWIMRTCRIPKSRQVWLWKTLDIEGTHWCSGLAIKQVHKTTVDGNRANRGVSSTETDIKNARKNLAMEILCTIDDSANSVKAWEKVDWKGFEKAIDEIQNLLAHKDMSNRSDVPVDPVPVEPVTSTAEIDAEDVLVVNKEDVIIDWDRLRAIMASSDQDNDNNHDQQS